MLHNKLAWRYIISRKSTQAINIITGVAIAGMMIGTAALIIVLSGFNGFEDVISGMTGKFNPDLKITLAEGKSWQPQSDIKQKLSAITEIDAVSMTLEELVLFEFDKNQNFGTLKGVDVDYLRVTNLDSTLIVGSNSFTDTERNYTTLGVGLANALAIRVNDPLNAITAYVPRRSKPKLMQKAFKSALLYPSGVFSILQEVDNTHVFTRLDRVQDLLDLKNHVSSIELSLAEQADIDQIKQQVKSVMGDGFIISDRIEQDPEFYKIINIERWVSAAIFSLIILLISFNLIGALWMIVLDKKLDISVLKSMGMTNQDVASIIGRSGLFITLMGIFGGLFVATLFILLHHQFGLIPIPDNFIADRYPLELRWTDYVATTVIVLLIGTICSLLPARRAARLEVQFTQS